MNKKKVSVVFGIILLLVLVIVIYLVLNSGQGNITTESLFEQIRTVVRNHLGS